MSTSSIARQPQGIPVGGQFAAVTHGEPALSLTTEPTPAHNAVDYHVTILDKSGYILGEHVHPTEAKAQEMADRAAISGLISTIDPVPVTLPGSEVLERAAGTDEDPRTVERPGDGTYVEVWVDDDAARRVLDDAGLDGDVVDNYSRVYCGVSLPDGRDGDFYGVKADGTEDLIGLDIRNYEPAVNEDNHEYLSFRDGFTNPMPAWNAADAKAKQERLDRSTALLERAGVSVEIATLHSEQFTLTNRDGGTLRLSTSGYQTKVQETRNWRTAGQEHYDAFLGGTTSQDTQKLLQSAVGFLGRDMIMAAYRDR